MDEDSPSIPQYLLHSDLPDHINSDLAGDNSEISAACGFCGRSLSSEADINSNLRTVSICGDCKFLLLEDYGNPSHESHQRRPSRRRRRLTYGSSESIEDLFSQQFTEIIHLARHIEPEHEYPSRDIDRSSSYHQPTSTHTTPDGSRRWRRVISDAESDGLTSDSFYGESESNVSFGGAYRVSYVDSDAVSFSGYGGDSDASVDGPAFLDTDIFAQSMGRSDIDSDSDIDPMHAGVVQWNFDDHEDEEDDNEWEVDGDENAGGPTEIGAHNIDISGGNDPLIRQRRPYSPEFEGVIRWRMREGRGFEIPSILTSMEDSGGGSPYLPNDQGDYLDARGFEEYLEHLVENDSSRRGAPPASASFVDSLPLIVISEDHQKESEGLACAICKDLLTSGTEVNRLPCLHLYHPSCILPWLSARNSCPLCRYELPTDDIDYELGKRNSSRMIISQIQEQDGRDDNSSISTDASEMDADRELGGMLRNVGPTGDSSNNGGRRGRWLFLAAAPIVGLMGVVLVLWLGNSLSGGVGQTVQHDLPRQHPQGIRTSDLDPRNQRVRRWWWF